MSQFAMGFSRPLKFKIFAALIMWWDKTRISHGFSMFPSTSWDVEFIYQAAGHNMHFLTRTNFEKINKIVELIYLDIPPEYIAKIGKYCAEKEGTPYGLKQVIGNIWISIIYKFTKEKIRNPFEDGDTTQTCIETQCRMIMEYVETAFGKEHLPKFDIESVSVKQVHEWIKTLPCVVKIERFE